MRRRREKVQCCLIGGRRFKTLCFPFQSLESFPAASAQCEWLFLEGLETGEWSDTAKGKFSTAGCEALQKKKLTLILFLAVLRQVLCSRRIFLPTRVGEYVRILGRRI